MRVIRRETRHSAWARRQDCVGILRRPGICRHHPPVECRGEAAPPAGVCQALPAAGCSLPGHPSRNAHRIREQHHAISPSASRRIGVAAISALACAAALVPSSAAAAPSPSASGRAVDRRHHGRMGRRPCSARPRGHAQQALEAYWTPKRMREADAGRGAAGVQGRARQHDRDAAAAKRRPPRAPPAATPEAHGQAVLGPVGRRRARQAGRRRRPTTRTTVLADRRLHERQDLLHERRRRDLVVLGRDRQQPGRRHGLDRRSLPARRPRRQLVLQLGLHPRLRRRSRQPAPVGHVDAVVDPDAPRVGHRTPTCPRTWA